METFIQTYVSFIVCTLLYFTSSHNAICYGREVGFIRSSVKKSIKASSFDVTSYGAKGDGETDDTPAFSKTWEAVCGAADLGVMLIPSGYTFLLNPPVLFNGSSCLSNIVIQVDGKIVAPNSSKWSKNDFQWILFTGLAKGITIQGKGVIDGDGASWWSGTADRPNALRISGSSHVIVSGITIQNAPRMHLYIDTSQDVSVFNVTVSSPGDSPNTDGIHLSNVQQAGIHDNNVACGDDCISIQSGTSDVKVSNLNCGPGHGFSIGGLGSPDAKEAHVSDIHVADSTFTKSLYGVRIKTWQDGFGTAKNISFSGMTMNAVAYPIVINQVYCNGAPSCPPPKTKDAVAISEVTYEGITGSYTQTSVDLECSEFQPCRRLTFSDINLTPSGSVASGVNGPKLEPYCVHAYGSVLTATTPSLTNCVLPETASRVGTLPPAMAPK
ncbi:hypothetical protein ABFX02_08G010300 [Erythranthe guttata]